MSEPKGGVLGAEVMAYELERWAAHYEEKGLSVMAGKYRAAAKRARGQLQVADPKTGNSVGVT